VTKLEKIGVVFGSIFSNFGKVLGVKLDKKAENKRQAFVVF
jgi:hypothetical protein